MAVQKVDWWFAPIVALVGGTAGGLLALTINTAGWGVASPILILLILLGVTGLSLAVNGHNHTAIAGPAIGALIASAIVVAIGAVVLIGG